MRAGPKPATRVEPPRSLAGRAAVERNLSDQVAAMLGREIVRGVHPPGAQLPNAQEMCARFQVSRTALREAYSLLNAKSLIVARPKTGTRVRPRDEWNLFDPEVLAWYMQSEPTAGFIADLFVLRQMVEPLRPRWRRRRIRKRPSSASPPPSRAWSGSRTAPRS